MKQLKRILYDNVAEQVHTSIPGISTFVDELFWRNIHIKLTDKLMRSNIINGAIAKAVNVESGIG